MNRTTGWILGGMVLLACLSFSVTGLFGQRFSTDHEGGSIGRFVVVRNTDDAVIIMDSTTGDLYKAGPEDLKLFRNRPQHMETMPHNVKDAIFGDDVKDKKTEVKDKIEVKDKVIKDVLIKDKDRIITLPADK